MPEKSAIIILKIVRKSGRGVKNRRRSYCRRFSPGTGNFMETRKYSAISKLKAAALVALYYIFLGLVAGGTLLVIIYVLYITRYMGV